MRNDDGAVPALDQLQVEANDLARRLARVQNEDARFLGSDPTRLVTVTMDGLGHVRQVAIRRDWPRLGAAAELANAVRAACETAALDRLRGLDLQMSENLEAPVAPADGAPAAGTDLAGARTTNELVDSLSAQATTESTVAALREVVHMLEDLDADLDRLSRQVADHQSRSYVGTSASRHVTVEVTAQGAVVGVDYDARWLRGAHEYNIGRETVEAFAVAHRLAAEQNVDRLVEASRIGALARLAGDPAELVRRLGLHDR